MMLKRSGLIPTSAILRRITRIQSSRGGLIGLERFGRGFTTSQNVSSETDPTSIVDKAFSNSQPLNFTEASPAPFEPKFKERNTKKDTSLYKDLEQKKSFDSKKKPMTNFSKFKKDLNSNPGVKLNEVKSKNEKSYKQELSYIKKVTEGRSTIQKDNKSGISSAHISQTLDSLGLRHEYNTTDKVFMIDCPSCHSSVSSKNPKTFLTPGPGTYFCSSCSATGPWQEYLSLIKQNLASRKEERVVKNNLGQYCEESLKDRIYKKVEENRKILSILSGPKSPIKVDTLDKYWVSVSDFETEPDPTSSIKPETISCAIFPRTSPITSFEGDYQQFKVVSLKASAFPSSRFVTFEPKTKANPGLFGYHLIPEDCDTIALTPNESDAMAIYQATGIPSVSLPKNIYQLSIEYLPLLARFKKIYLWFSGDISGQNAAQLFARKLGYERCYIVKNENLNLDPCKSAYDALRKEFDLRELINAAKLHTHSKILDFDAIKDSVLLEVMHADQVQGVPSEGFPSFNQIIKGFRPGELTIFSGPTGMGKTTFLSQLSLDYCRSGVSTMWGSFEISNTRLAKKMLFQFAEKTIEPDFKEYHYWADKFHQLPLYFMKFFGTTKIEEVINAMEHAVYAYDVQHILIDNLQFMTSGLGKGFERYEIQDDALSIFRKFATEHNVHVTLVVHPRKDDREFLEIGSVFGSAKITQEADNVIILQNGPDNIRYIDVKKNRFDGTVGMVPVRFDKNSLKSYELDPEDLKNLNKMLSSQRRAASET